MTKDLKHYKNAKAITLIALIVTIIVLLILAGVSIAVLTGENGILNRATEAKKTNEQKTAEEELKLGILALSTDYYSKTTRPATFRDFVFTDDSKAKLNQELNGGATFNGTNYTITYKNVTYQVAENGTLSKAEGIVLLDKLTLISGVDASYQLTAEQKNIEAPSLTWTSSDESVATVGSTTGLVTVEGQGTATITVSGTYNNKNYTAECNVTVEPVTIDLGEDREIVKGGSETLTPTITPLSVASREDITINWTSSVTSVATVSPATGASTTVSVPSGATTNETSTITVTIKKGNTTLATDTCTVKAIVAVGKFKTESGVAYYYAPGATTGIAITTNPSDSGYLGKYLGMKVDYTPYSKFSDRGTSSTYRLFYIDVNNKYGDGCGTIYLKADGDGNRRYLINIDTTNKTDVNVMNEFNPLWAANSTYSASTYNNAIYTKYLLDKGIWARYTDTGNLENTQIAKYAVGAPSLEMWIDSYNAFLVANPVSGKYTQNYTVTQDTTNGPTGANDGYGYYIGYNGEYIESGYATDSDTLVYPSSYSSNATAEERVKAWKNGSMACWLASPSASSGGNVMFVASGDGGIGYRNASSYEFTFCPIVSIKSGVTISEVEQ